MVRDCRARRILVQRADNDDEQPGDFATPAMLRRGAVTVSGAEAVRVEPSAKVVAMVARLITRCAIAREPKKPGGRAALSVRRVGFP